VFEASTSPLKERYAQTDTNVFQLSRLGTFCGPADRGLAQRRASASGAGRRGRSDGLEPKCLGKEEWTDEVIEKSTDFRCWHETDMLK
jgi:hypothetical protein